MRSHNTPVDAGIGLHFGVVFSGVVGDETRLEYSVFGDTVNVAARYRRCPNSLGRPCWPRGKPLTPLTQLAGTRLRKHPCAAFRARRTSWLRTVKLGQIRKNGCNNRGTSPLNRSLASVTARHMQSAPTSAIGVCSTEGSAISTSPRAK